MCLSNYFSMYILYDAVTTILMVLYYISRSNVCLSNVSPSNVSGSNIFPRVMFPELILH